MIIRKATLADAAGIHKLINSHAKKNEMLPRSLSEIYENIRDYFVAITGKQVLGVAGLHINWEDLAEVKSVAVATRHQKRGIGQALVDACIQEAQELQLKTVYVLTYVPGFFKKKGFKQVKREALPQKVWRDCIKCPKFPNCDEIAMIRQLQSEIKKK